MKLDVYGITWPENKGSFATSLNNNQNTPFKFSKKGWEETNQLERKIHLKQNSQDLQLSIEEEDQFLDSQLTQQKDRIVQNLPPLCNFIMKHD